MPFKRRPALSRHHRRCEPSSASSAAPSSSPSTISAPPPQTLVALRLERRRALRSEPRRDAPLQAHTRETRVFPPGVSFSSLSTERDRNAPGRAPLESLSSRQSLPRGAILPRERKRETRRGVAPKRDNSNTPRAPKPRLFFRARGRVGVLTRVLGGVEGDERRGGGGARETLARLRRALAPHAPLQRVARAPRRRPLPVQTRVQALQQRLRGLRRVQDRRLLDRDQLFAFPSLVPYAVQGETIRVRSREFRTSQVYSMALQNALQSTTLSLETLEYARPTTHAPNVP